MSLRKEGRTTPMMQGCVAGAEARANLTSTMMSERTPTHGYHDDEADDA